MLGFEDGASHIVLNFNTYIFKVTKVRKKRRMWKERKKLERE